MTFPQSAGYPSGSTRTEGEMKLWFENTLSISKEMPGGSGWYARTLSSDTFTPINNQYAYELTSQSGTTDSISTIAPGSVVPNGRQFFLRPATGHTITVVNALGAAGEIRTIHGANIVLSDPKQVIKLKYRSSGGGYWEMLPSPRNALILPVGGVAGNRVWASPDGSTGAPSYRALVAADLPVVTVAKGGFGTGGLTGAAAYLPVGAGSSQFKQITGTAGQVPTINAAGTDIAFADFYAEFNNYRRHYFGQCDSSGNPTWWGPVTSPTLNGVVDSTYDLDAFGRYSGRKTNAANLVAGQSCSGANLSRWTQRQWSPLIRISFKTGPTSADIQQARFWVGVASAANLFDTDTPTTMHVMGLTYSTAVDGTVFWRTYTSDGSAGTRTASSAAIAYNTRYELIIDCSNSAQVDFYLNGTLINSHTTNLPGSSTNVAPYMCLKDLGTTYGKFFLFHRLDMRSK